MKILNCSQSIELRGDDSGRDNIFFYRDKDQVFVSNLLSELVQGLKARGHKLEISDIAINHFLHHGLISYPHSIYQNIHTLGIGDKAEFHPEGRIRFSSDYTYNTKKCRADQEPSEEKLLSLLCESTTQCLNDQNGCLMLSSGKDSLSLALAVKAAGLSDKVQALTYSNGDKSEATYAKQICSRLGLRHAIVSLPSSSSDIRDVMIRFFENSVQPVCDPVTAAYVLASNAIPSHSNILDGSGNDSYMGYVSHSRDYFIFRCKLIAQAFRWLSPLTSRFFSFYSPIGRIMKHPVIHYSLMHMRHEDTRKFYNSSMSTDSFWDDILREWKRSQSISTRDILCSFDAFLGFDNILGCYLYDGAHVLVMRKEVADAMQHSIHFPWANLKIANYYFHLPPQEKYNLTTHTNKLLVRKMLKKYLQHEEAKKRVFEFDLVSFFLKNESFVRQEILDCKLWNKNMPKFLSKLWDVLHKNPRVEYALNALFLISGWHNHSKYLP